MFSRMFDNMNDEFCLTFEFIARFASPLLALDSFEYMDNIIHVKKTNGVIEFANYIDTKDKYDQGLAKPYFGDNKENLK